MLGRIKSPVIPAFVTSNSTDTNILPSIKPVAGTPLTFKTAGLGMPTDVTLVPFYSASDFRYTVYWNTYSPAEWDKHQADVAATEAHRREIGNQTVDTVTPGAGDSESSHNYQNQNAAPTYHEGRPGREARQNGWFSYDLAVSPDQPLTLVCTYRGSGGRTRTFDILIDGQTLKTETLSSQAPELFDVEYAIPDALITGKSKVTVKFQPHPESLTAPIFDVRIVRRSAAGK